jgi:ParB family chromosome partitioning protein
MTEPAVDRATEPGTEVEASSVDGPGVVGGAEQPGSSITLEDGSSYLLVDPSTLIIGPNVRTAADLAKGFKNFAQDIGQRGVKAPIRAHRNAQGELVVIEGQMRVLAALDKGRKRVRVLVEPEIAGDETEQEIERIIGQLNDNHHRTANTEADEVRATQQLLELGVTARALERRRSIPRRRAQNLVAVASSAAGSRSVTDGIADLAQAGVFVEFDGDEDATTALTDCLQKDPGRFDHVAQRLRDDREETRLRAEAAARLIEQGVTVIDEPNTYGGPIRPLSELRASLKTQPGTRLTPSKHAKCPGHAAYLDYSSRRPADKRVEVVYACTDHRTHEHPLLWQSSSTPASVVGAGQRGGKMTEEQKAARRTVIANGKAWDSATTVRRAWLTAFARKTPPKDATQWRTRMEAEGSPALQGALEKDHPLAVELLGLTEKEGRSRYNRAVSHPIADAAATATRARAEMLSLIMLLAAIEDTTDRRRTWETPTREQRDYFTQLAAWGYPLEQVEQLVLGDSQPATTSPAIDPPDATEPRIAEAAEEPDAEEQGPHHQDGAAEASVEEHAPLAA